VRPERGGLTGSRVPGEIARDGKSPPVLALHGFTGTPFEVELAVEAASSVGLAALAPLLPGHGTHARDLAKTRFADWTASAEAALDRVQAPAVVTGLSMGSLLALDLAIRRPESVRALALLGNAVWLSAHWALVFAERARLPDFLAPKKGGSDIADPTSQSSHVSYDAHPVHAAIDLRRAGERIRERLGEVRCPTLILHGAKDRTCPVSNAWRVAERLGTDDQRVIVFPRSRHILTRDVEQAAVRRELAQFYARFTENVG